MATDTSGYHFRCHFASSSKWGQFVKIFLNPYCSLEVKYKGKRVLDGIGIKLCLVVEQPITKACLKVAGVALSLELSVHGIAVKGQFGTTTDLLNVNIEYRTTAISSADDVVLICTI